MSTEHKSYTDKANKDSWATPQYIFDYFNKIFNFDFDVAASADNAKCEDFYTIEDNALIKVWGDVNWCNPPYSNIKPWVEKAIFERMRNNKTVMLLPSDTSVEWFRLAFDNCSECIFISGRLSFINAATGKQVSGNNKGSVVFVFGDPVLQKVKLIKRDSLYGGKK